jgi:hypothetical protein
MWSNLRQIAEARGWPYAAWCLVSAVGFGLARGLWKPIADPMAFADPKIREEIERLR